VAIQSGGVFITPAVPGQRRRWIATAFGLAMTVPTSSLRGAKRRGNPVRRIHPHRRAHDPAPSLVRPRSLLRNDKALAWRCGL